MNVLESFMSPCRHNSSRDGILVIFLEIEGATTEL